MTQKCVFNETVELYRKVEGLSNKKLVGKYFSGYQNDRIKRNVIIIVLKKYSNVHIISLKMVCVQTKNMVLLSFGTP